MGYQVAFLKQHGGCVYKEGGIGENASETRSRHSSSWRKSAFATKTKPGMPKRNSRSPLASTFRMRDKADKTCGSPSGDAVWFTPWRLWYWQLGRQGRPHVHLAAKGRLQSAKPSGYRLFVECSTMESVNWDSEPVI
jgi:hypothetical protein